MSAIGGIINLKRGNVDFSAFYNIRNSLALRGRELSTAYLDLGIAMLYCSDGFADIDLPTISERRGYVTALTYDACIAEPKALLERYRAQGVEFISSLAEPFALALYDGERRMLMLARDKNGKKPLYYILKEGKIYFASEPKGLLSINGATKVNAKALSEHLTSPVGIYGASDIYPDICEVRKGECILFTELGISRFFYREGIQKRVRSTSEGKKRDIPTKGFMIVNNDCVMSALSDSLVAFDMPQFDAHIPRVSQTLLKAKSANLTSLVLEDAMRIRHMGYAIEREDRLGAFYGVKYVGVPEKLDERELNERRKENNDLFCLLRNEFFLREKEWRGLLNKIFGERKLAAVISVIEKRQEKNEDTEQMIRILGMLLQTLEWVNLRDVEFVCNEKRLYSYND